MQETYVRAIRSWRSYEPGTNLRALAAADPPQLRDRPGAPPTARARRRAAGRGRLLPLQPARPGAAGRARPTSSACIEQLSQGPVMDALADLPQNFKEVVVLVDLGDFSYQEAADILEIPIGTVMSRLHRGRPRAEEGAGRRERGGMSTTVACHEAEQRLQAYVDRALTPDEVDRDRGPPRVCPPCARCYKLETHMRGTHAPHRRRAVPRVAQGPPAQPVRGVRLRVALPGRVASAATADRAPAGEVREGAAPR